jgi:hypothetical protein
LSRQDQCNILNSPFMFPFFSYVASSSVSPQPESFGLSFEALLAQCQRHDTSPLKGDEINHVKININTRERDRNVTRLSIE